MVGYGPLGTLPDPSPTPFPLAPPRLLSQTPLSGLLRFPELSYGESQFQLFLKHSRKVSKSRN